MSKEQTREDGVKYQIHSCQSVEGGIRFWERSRKKIIPWITDDNGRPMTRDAVLWELRRHREQGHRMIPLGEPCEGFDYEKGCPGHRLPD